MTKQRERCRPIAVDLFAGAGGMTLGFEQAGFDVLASVELDPIHCATHEFNFPFWSIFCASVTEISGKKIRSFSAIKNRDIDVVFGGPPCQGFSLIGKRVLDDPRNSLIWHFVRLILELKPKFFVIENVPGMASSQSKQLLFDVIEQLIEHDYNVERNFQILNAASYGVPQNRKRLFLLGSRRDIPLPSYPQPVTKPVNGKQIDSALQLPNSPTVWDAIQDLPEIECYLELCQRDWTIAEFTKPSLYGEELRGLRVANHDYSYPRYYDSRILSSSLRTKHSLESMRRFEATPPGKTESISHFFKLDPEGICNTLRAGTASNRGAFTSPRPIHPFKPRCITVREAARLHSYPDWFRFHVTKWHGFRQVGNSVPPRLAKAIASELINVLGISPSQPTIIQNLGEERLLRFDMSQAAHYYGVDPCVIEPRTKPSNKASPLHATNN